MSDAFRNYNNLISGLNQSQNANDVAIRSVAESKEKAAEMGKTIGEVKSFLSGQHGGRSFAKDIKPILKKRAERLAERAKAQLEEKVQGIKAQVEQRLAAAKQNAADRLAQGRQAVEDRLNGTPREPPNTDGENPTQRTTPDENEPEPNGEYDDWDKPYEGDDAYDSWDKPYEGDDAFDAWDRPWGGDTIAESRAGTFSNPLANARANLQNPAEQDSQNPMEPRSDPPSYDESISDTTKTSPVDPDETPEGPPKFNANSGDGDDALGNESQMSNVSTKATGAGDTTDATAQEALDKQLADKMAKEAAEKVAVKGGEDAAADAATGVLDAIPGLDVLGFIGGAILAGFQAKKEKKEEGREDAGAGVATQAIQIGVGGE